MLLKTQLKPANISDVNGREITDPAATQEATFGGRTGSNTLTRAFMCPWNKVYGLLDEYTTSYDFDDEPVEPPFLGDRKINLAASTMTISTPKYDGLGSDHHPIVRSTDIGIVPFAGDRVQATDIFKKTLKVAHKIVTINYELVPRGQFWGEGPYYPPSIRVPNGLKYAATDIAFTEEFEAAHEFRLLKTDKAGNELYWDDETEVGSDAMLGKLFHVTTWTYKIIGMPKVPIQYMENLGKVNQLEILSWKLGDSFASEKVLYNDLKLHPWTDWTGELLYDLELEFLVHMDEDATWNKFITNDGTWRGLKLSDGAGGFNEKDAYELVDLSSMVYTNLEATTTGIADDLGKEALWE